MSLINQCGNSYRAHWHEESSNQNRDERLRYTFTKSNAETFERGFEFGSHGVPNLEDWHINSYLENIVTNELNFHIYWELPNVVLYATPARRFYYW